MNGKVIADATSLEQSERLPAVVRRAFFLTTAGRVEKAVPATLLRRPNTRESSR